MLERKITPNTDTLTNSHEYTKKHEKRYKVPDIRINRINRHAVLTWIIFGAGGEEDTQSRLIVDGHAGPIVPAHVDAVRQHERPRL